jgi:hypothetical protein
VVENSGNWQSRAEEQTDDSAFRIHFMQFFFVQMADQSCVFLNIFPVFYIETLSAAKFL